MIHCWLKFRRHKWAWREGIHRLCRFYYCTKCGWPGGIDLIRDKENK